MVFVPAQGDASSVARLLKRKWRNRTARRCGRFSIAARREALESDERKIMLVTAVARAEVTLGSCALVLSSGLTKQTVIDSGTRRLQLVRRSTTERELIPGQANRPCA